MNDFIQLTPQSNVYEAETMVEGKVYLSSNVVEISHLRSLAICILIINVMARYIGGFFIWFRR